jgi:hypothetical protein
LPGLCVAKIADLFLMMVDCLDPESSKEASASSGRPIFCKIIPLPTRALSPFFTLHNRDDYLMLEEKRRKKIGKNLHLLRLQRNESFVAGRSTAFTLNLRA